MRHSARSHGSGSPQCCCVACMRAARPRPATPTSRAYAPSTLAKVLGGTARSQNDEAELAGLSDWYTTTANFTGRKRPPSGRFRPIIGAWVSSRGLDPSTTEMYFSGDLPELEFEQGGRKYWVMAGLPGGLGFDVYPPGQKLTIYLQKVGFASGTPVAVLTMAKLPTGVTSTTVTKGPRDAQCAHGRRCAPPGGHVPGRQRDLHLRRPRVLPAARCQPGAIPLRPACIRTKTVCARLCSSTARATSNTCCCVCR